MTVRPLVNILAEIPDPRRGQGRRYSLVAILMLLAVALLCGIQGYKPALEWASALDASFLLALGFDRGRIPCPSTLCKLLPRLDLRQFEQQLQQWAESILAGLPPQAEEGEAVAVDGKSLRGSRKQGAEHVHLLSAVSQRLGLTLFQTAVDDKTNEIKAVMTVLAALALEGRIVTMDALLTQREVARTVVEAQGDYIMVVKDNQPELRADIAYLFQMPWCPPPRCAKAVLPRCSRPSGTLRLAFCAPQGSTRLPPLVVGSLLSHPRLYAFSMGCCDKLSSLNVVTPCERLIIPEKW